AANHFSGHGLKLKIEDEVPDRPDAVMVLAMDVVGDRASESHELRSRDDRQEVAARHEEVQNIRQCHSRLRLTDSGRRIEGDQPIQALERDYAGIAVESGVAVTASEPSGDVGGLAAAREDLFERRDLFRPIDSATLHRKSAPSGERANQGRLHQETQAATVNEARVARAPAEARRTGAAARPGKPRSRRGTPASTSGA